ncbi:MAG: hypothetical protein K9M60_01295, partial [Akkermansiaceae bacterium]|nr:hypothetical protein [Akkermansiaceae bacterium]
DTRRFWDFRSPGRGDIQFEDIIIALNDIGYGGPLSVEWEDIRNGSRARWSRSCILCAQFGFPGQRFGLRCGFR